MRNSKSSIADPGAGAFAAFRATICSLAAALSMLALTACVTRTVAQSTIPAVSFLLFPPATLQAGGQAQLAATITNDPKMLGIDWVASCATASCGSFNPAHTTNGLATTYTAPGTVPVGGVNLAARATANPAQTVVSNVTIFTNVTIKLTGYPASPLGAANTTTLTAVVTGDPNNPPLGVGWSLTCTASVCGTLSAVTTASGVPVTYTAPTTVTSSFTVTFQATPLADTTQIITASITVNPSSSVTVTLSPAPPGNIVAGATVNVGATVSNDPAAAGVDWTVTCTNSAAAGQCGTFTSPPHTASGALIAYTAPSTVPTAGLPVTITATSTDTPSAFQSAMSTITSPTLSVAITTLPPSSMPVSTTGQVIATLQNDVGNKGVTWSASCTAATGSNCGSFSPSATTTGMATTYQSPTVIPTNTGGVVTITATTVATPVQMATATVTVTAADTVGINWTSSSETPPAELTQGGVARISATVLNDPLTSPNGVSWAANCTPGTGGDCGSFSVNPTASGVQTQYTAPSVIPVNNTVTVVATAQASPSPSLSQVITITAPVLTVTLVTPFPTSIEAGTAAQFTANVANDSPTSPNGVTWTVTCTGGTGTNPCGSFSPAATASGAATTYTAPSSIPTGDSGDVVITATSAAQTNVTASTPGIPITANTSAGLLNGQYALNISGENGFGFFAAVGSIIADGEGHITMGEEDTPPVVICGETAVTGITGSYTIGSDGRGSLTLSTGSNCFGASGTQTFSVTVTGSSTPATHVLISEFDNVSGSGSLDIQDTTDIAKGLGAITGTYAFVFDGYDLNNPNPNTGLSTTDFGGTLTVGGGGQLTIASDINDQGLGTVTTGSGSGTYTSPDTFGRSTVTLDGNSYVFYVVNAGQMKYLENDGVNFVAIGPAYTSSSSAFSGNYVFTWAGVDGNPSAAVNSTVVAGGYIMATGTSLLGQLDLNDQGLQTGSGGTAFTGTLVAATSGRGTFTLHGTPTGVTNFAFYPTASNGILMLERDTDFASIGAFLSQTGTTLAAGNFATNLTNATAGVVYPEQDAVGQVISDGTSMFTGTFDFFNTNGFYYPGAPMTGAFAASGQGRYTGDFDITTNATSQDLKEIFYVVSPSTVLFIQRDASAQTSGVMLVQ